MKKITSVPSVPQKIDKTQLSPRFTIIFEGHAQDIQTNPLQITDTPFGKPVAVVDGDPYVLESEDGTFMCTSDMALEHAHILEVGTGLLLNNKNRQSIMNVIQWYMEGVLTYDEALTGLKDVNYD